MHINMSDEMALCRQDRVDFISSSVFFISVFIISLHFNAQNHIDSYRYCCYYLIVISITFDNIEMCKYTGR